MTDVTTIADTYLASWNETDASKRAELIAQAWAADGRYVDPQADVEGHDAFAELVAAVQERFPGYRFRRTGDADVHHDQARFGWELVAPDGAVALSGLDVAELAGDGRLRRVTGFFDALVAP
jgi:SnoaL-like domain